MKHDEGRVAGAGGLELFYQRWSPIAGPRACLGLVHGLGSHSGCFERLVMPLVQAGYVVYGLDLRGHGRSPGPRGYVHRWREFREDLASFHGLMATNWPGVPCLLGGHSLGATVMLDYGLQNPAGLAGMIAIAPAIGPVGISPLKLAIGRLLSWLWPTFSLEVGIPETAGSRDLSVLAAYAADPLRHTQGTARLVTEFLQTTQRLRAELPGLQVPLLILQGSADVVTPPAGSRELFEQLPAIAAEYREYPQGYHDLHNDLCSAQIVKDIIGWTSNRISRRSPLCIVR